MEPTPGRIALIEAMITRLHDQGKGSYDIALVVMPEVFPHELVAVILDLMIKPVQP